MSTKQSTVDYILDQLADLPRIETKKMFGEYALYVSGKVVGLICDDTLFIKITDAGKEFVGEHYKEGFAYPGAKASMEIEGDMLENREWLSTLIMLTENHMPPSKPKKQTPRARPLDVQAYHNALSKGDRAICDILAKEITQHLPKAEHKIWHAHPVWFLEGNPVVGYSKLKDSVRLLFWSGQSFNEKALHNEGSFKAAEVRYTDALQINKKDLKRWLKKAQDIQWDYKNIVKRKGVLKKIMPAKKT